MPQMSPMWWELLFCLSIFAALGILVNFFFGGMKVGPISSLAKTTKSFNPIKWVW